jgi:hypothetical protein
LPFERTAMNGFGFLQIVRPRRHSSLLELASDRPAFEARALLRRASREVGAIGHVAHPSLISPRSPEMEDHHPRQVFGAVSRRPPVAHCRASPGMAGPPRPSGWRGSDLARGADARHVGGPCRTSLNPAPFAASRRRPTTPRFAAAAARTATCSNGLATAMPSPALPPADSEGLDSDDSPR